MTKITIETADGTNSVEASGDHILIDDIVDLFGALLILCTYTHDNVCECLNTETFNIDRLRKCSND